MPLLRSDLLTICLPNSAGKQTTFYTYDGYLQDEDRHKMRQEKHCARRNVFTLSSLFFGLGFVGSKKIPLPHINIKGFSIPLSGIVSGLLSGFIGYQLTSLYTCSKISRIQRQYILAAKHLPLWSNLRNAVNPDRAYFQLADDRHNQPLLFHSGLTPQAAARLIPDKTIGTVPPKPTTPSSHDHGHH